MNTCEIIAPSTKEELLLDFFAGTWAGQGTIVVLETASTLHFDIHKTVICLDNELKITQTLEIKEIEETWVFNLTASNFKKNTFLIDFSCNKLEEFKGDGVFNDQDVFWKFYGQDNKIIGKAQFTNIKNNYHLINSTYRFPGKAQVSVSGYLEKISNGN